MKTILLPFLVVCLCVYSVNSQAQTTAAGKVDLTFTQTNLFGYRPNAPVVAIGVQTNGQVLIGGNFTQPYNKYGLARLNVDGMPDNSFTAYVKRNNTLGNPTLAGTINQIVRRPDGGFYIKGLFHAVANVAGYTNLAALDANGNHDTNFVAAGLDADLLTAAKISVQNDNRILVNTISNVVYRLSLSGAVADTMSLSNLANIFSLAADTNGGFYVAGSLTNEFPTRARVFHYFADGSPDANFVAPLFDSQFGAATALDLPLVQADGKVLVNGYFISAGGTQRGGLCRLNVDGTLDTSFVPGASGIGTIYQGSLIGLTGLTRLPDGRFIIFRDGPFRYDNIYRNGIARISSSGALDSTFDPGTGPQAPSFGFASPDGQGIQVIASAANGDVYVGGTFTNFNKTGRIYIARLNAGPVSAKPAIVSNPQSVSVTNGVDVTFTVIASGPGTLSYTWAHNGAVIPGATSASLTVTNVDLQDVGAYIVTVINSAGSTAALPAVLTVNGVSVPDLTGPTFKITSPAGTFALVTTNTYTFTGTAADAQGIARLHYKQDANPWTNINMTTNWAFTVNLNPGTNIFLITVSDLSGNYAVTQRATVFYTVPHPLQLSIVGNGKITGATNGQLFPIGRSVSFTAAPATGWLLTNWLVQVSGNPVLSTNKAAPFLMQSNLALTVTFVDITKPLVKVVAPKAGGRWSNDLITVTGTLTDNNPSGTVFCRVNGQGWVAGTGWTNWFCQLDSPPGTNTLDIYAMDAQGNRSLTNTLKFIRVVMWPLNVTLVGNGKLTPTNGQLLEIGKNVLPKLTLSTGWILTNWLVTVEGSHVLDTNKLTAFIMRTNTALQATFADVTKPLLTITAPAAGQKWSNELFIIKGKVTDNNPSGTVWYQLNNGGWSSATGWTNWQQDVTLIPGTNILQTYAQDAAGNRSLTNTSKVNYLRMFTLADYFPQPLGAYWRYTGYDSDSNDVNLSWEIVSTNHPVDLYAAGNPPKQFFTNSIKLNCAYLNPFTDISFDDWQEFRNFNAAGQIVMYGDDDLPDESLRVGNGLAFPAQMFVGGTAKVSGAAYSFGVSQGTISLTFQLLEHGSLTVPAGTFDDVLHIRMTFSSSQGSQSKDWWWARDIGQIKSRENPTSNFGSTFELDASSLLPAPIPASPMTVAAVISIAAPPQIGSPGFINGQFGFDLTGAAAQTVVIETSTNLQDWTPVETITLDGAPRRYVPPVDSSAARFYRVR